MSQSHEPEPLGEQPTPAAAGRTARPPGTPVSLDTKRPGTGPNGSLDSPSLGQQLGNYELLSEIGRGGMGIVYRARQVATDRIVALKLIRSDLLSGLPEDTRQMMLDRFRQEVQAAARLDHDNIVTVYDGGEIQGHPFLAMRFVRGRSLGEMIQSEGQLEPARAARYIASVARAVEAAHHAGVVHRDIKPQNVLVDEQTDRALITDFGVAKLRTAPMNYTQQGAMLGTPGYMSPEQYRDAANVGPPSDVYSLGATLYVLLTGDLPFPADTPWEMMRQVLNQDPVPPSTRNRKVESGLDAICLKCLAKQPDDRYAGAALLADDLERALRGEPVVAAGGRSWRAPPALARPNGIAAACLLMLFAAAVAWPFLGPGDKHDPSSTAKRLVDAHDTDTQQTNELSAIPDGALRVAPGAESATPADDIPPPTAGAQPAEPPTTSGGSDNRNGSANAPTVAATTSASVSGAKPMAEPHAFSSEIDNRRTSTVADGQAVTGKPAQKVRSEERSAEPSQAVDHSPQASVDQSQRTPVAAGAGTSSTQGSYSDKSRPGTPGVGESPADSPKPSVRSEAPAAQSNQPDARRENTTTNPGIPRERNDGRLAPAATVWTVRWLGRSEDDKLEFRKTGRRWEYYLNSQLTMTLQEASFDPSGRVAVLLDPQSGRTVRLTQGEGYVREGSAVRLRISGEFQTETPPASRPAKKTD